MIMRNVYYPLIAILSLFSFQTFAQNKKEVKVTVKALELRSSATSDGETNYDYRVNNWMGDVINGNCIKLNDVAVNAWHTINSFEQNRFTNYIINDLSLALPLYTEAWEEDGCSGDCGYHTSCGGADEAHCGRQLPSSSIILYDLVPGNYNQWPNLKTYNYCGTTYQIKYLITYTPPEPNIPTIKKDGITLSANMPNNDTNCDNPEIELTSSIQIKPEHLDHIKYAYQYRIGNETYEYEEPNPAYCGDSGGCEGGGPVIFAAPLNVSKIPIIVDPNLPPCCYEPPTITKTAPLWRTVPGPMIDAHLQSTQGGKKFLLRSLPGLENITANTTVRFRVIAHANGTVSPVSGQSLTVAISPLAPQANIDLANIQPSCTVQPTGSITLPNITSQFPEYRYILRAGDIPSFGTCQPNATNSNNCFPATDKVGTNTGSTLTIDQVNPGVYTLFLLNSFGTQGFCPRRIGTLTVNAIPDLQVSPAPAPDLLLSCYGVPNAQITLSTNGGQPNAVSYQLVNQTSGVVASQNTSLPNASVQFQNLDVGNYTLAVSDGCTPQVNQSFAVKQPVKINEVAFQFANATCADPGNGIVTASVTRSTGTFDVSTGTDFAYVLYKDGAATPYKNRTLNTAANNLNWNDLQAGSYQLLVTEKNGAVCNGLSKTFVVQNPAPLAIHTLAVTTVSCFGGNDGALAITGTGGTQQFAYTLNQNGAPVANNENGNFAGLSAGSYTVTIKNTIACNDTFTSSVISVAEPDKIGINLTSKNISCFGLEDGEISAAVTGGTPAYQYRWQVLLPSGWADLPQTSAKILGLANEQFRLRITDSKTCISLSNPVAIQEPEKLSFAAIAVQDIKCFGESGNILPQATGGTGAYAYSFSLNGNNPLVLTPQTPVSAGNYAIGVTDANGCQHTHASLVAVTAPPAPLTFTTQLSTYNGVNVSCFGGSNGSILIVPAGGNGNGYSGYTSSLLASPFTSTLLYTNLPAGTFTLSLQDNRGCVVSQPVTLTQSDEALQLQLVEKTDVVCDGESNGKLQVAGQGGVAPYQYQLGNQNPQAGNLFTNLPVGAYTLTISDANQCTNQQTYAIASLNPPMVLSASVNAVKCFGENSGKVLINVSGGLAPYQYNWQHGGTLPASENLAKGTYTVNVTDNAGCAKTLGVSVTEPPAPLSLSATTTPLCFGKTSGSLKLTATGGTSPYQYALQSNPVFAAAATFALPPGTHFALARDANGCETTAQTNITVRTDKPEPNFLAATAPHAKDVVVLIDVSLPKPDSIHWVFDAAAEIVDGNNQAPAIRFAEPGQYEVRMTGFFSGCDYELLKTLTINPFDPTAELEKLPDFVPIKQVSVSPNPNNGTFSLALTLSKPYAVSLYVYDMLGQTHYQKQLSGVADYTDAITLADGASGVYLLRIVTDTDSRDVRLVINR